MASSPSEENGRVRACRWATSSDLGWIINAALGQLGEGLGRTGVWGLARERDRVGGGRGNQGLFCVGFLPLITCFSDLVLSQ